MKTRSRIARRPCCVLTLGFVILSAAGVNAQGTFQNLSFEQGQFVPKSSSTSGTFEWAPAFPGWTGESLSTGLIDEVYGRGQILPLDRAIIGLGANHSSLVPRFGLYSASLMAGPQFPYETVSLWQIGQIPVTARSIRICMSGFPSTGEVSIGGRPLNMALVESAQLFSVYVADVSNHSGTTAELRFSVTVPAGGQFSWISLAAIEFSPVPVPEPAAFQLGMTAILALLIFNSRPKVKERSGGGGARRNNVDL